MSEPLLHFLGLALLIFAVDAWVSGDTRELLVVDVATQEYLVSREQEVRLEPLSEAERTELVEGFIEEEILVREAIKRGYTDSSRVRALLAQNMRFLITGDIPEPTEEELRTFFIAEKSSFGRPPSVSLEHLLYNDPAEVPDDLVRRLSAGADASGFGDLDLSYGRKMRFMDTRRLAAAFGGEGARLIEGIDPADNDWHGPIQSPQGYTHFVRVLERHPAMEPQFDAVKDWVSTRWVAAQARQSLDGELAVMRENYRVEIEPIAAEP